MEPLLRLAHDISVYTDPSTDNEIRISLEPRITAFQNPGRDEAGAAVDQALALLEAASSRLGDTPPFNAVQVQFFCLSALAKTAGAPWLWNRLDDAARARARSEVLDSIQNSAGRASVVTAKAALALVLIARVEWPAGGFPDFHVIALRWCSQASPALAKLGFLVLKIASEEFLGPKCLRNMGAVRANELRSLLATGVVRDLFDSATKKLSQLTDGGWSRLEGQVTPYGSPANGGLHTSITNKERSFAASFSPESRELATEIIECVSAQLTWVTLESALTPQLLETILHYSSMFEEGITGSIGARAIVCLNELLSRKCPLPDCLLHIYSFCIKTLQVCVNLGIASFDQDYLENFIGLIDILLRLHYASLKARLNNAEMMEFLEILCAFSLLCHNTDSFFRCLDIVNTFLDHFDGTATLPSLVTSTRDSLAAMTPALRRFVRGLFNKATFADNPRQLQNMMPSSSFAEDEYRKFLDSVILSTLRVSMIIPGVVATEAEALWNATGSRFSQISRVAQKGLNGIELVFASSSDAETCNAVCMDMATACIVCGSVAGNFTAENGNVMEGQRAVQNLLELEQFLTATGIAGTDNPLVRAVHIEVLRGLQSFSHWLVSLSLASSSKVPSSSLYSVLSKAFITCALNAILHQYTDEIKDAGFCLLCSILSPEHGCLDYFIQMPRAQELFGRIHEVMDPLPSLVQSHGYEMALNVIMLMAKRDGWDGVKENFLALLAPSIERLVTVSSSSSDLIDVVAVSKCARLLGHFANLVRSYKLAVRGAFVGALKPAYGAVMNLLHRRDVDREVFCAIVAFLHALFSNFLKELDLQFIQQALQAMIDMIVGLIGEKSQAQQDVTLNFFGALETVVSERRKEFRDFVLTIVHSCITSLQPLIIGSGQPDVRHAFYKLLRRFLDERWKLFFGIGSHELLPKHETLFAQILVSIMDPLMRGGEYSTLSHGSELDLEGLELSLDTLLELHSRHNLFFKRWFQMKLRHDTVNAMLKCLSVRHLDQIHEALTKVLFHIAESDSVWFCPCLGTFLLNSGLDDTQAQGLVVTLMQASDEPTFVRNLAGIVSNDTA